MKIAERIKVPAEYHKDIDRLQEDANKHRVAMDHHAEQYIKKLKILWAFIEEVVPECVPDIHHFKYNSETHELVCIGYNLKND